MMALYLGLPQAAMSSSLVFSMTVRTEYSAASSPKLPMESL